VQSIYSLYCKFGKLCFLQRYLIVNIPCLSLKVSGEYVDTELNLRRRGASYSILFYAAWCPFSSKFLPIFEALSTMYPQIQHFAVEESSATPRYVNVELFCVILLN
jgi:thiol-disulfide isomerase/thioredoxin